MEFGLVISFDEKQVVERTFEEVDVVLLVTFEAFDLQVVAMVVVEILRPVADFGVFVKRA